MRFRPLTSRDTFKRNTANILTLDCNGAIKDADVEKGLLKVNLKGICSEQFKQVSVNVAKFIFCIFELTFKTAHLSSLSEGRI